MYVFSMIILETYSQGVQVVQVRNYVLNKRHESGKIHFIEGTECNPAGDVTRVSVMPRKVTVKIGDAENRCRGCRDKNR